MRRLWTPGAPFTGLGGPCAIGAGVSTRGFAPGGIGGSDWRFEMIKKVVEFVVDVVGLVVAVIGITIFGIAFS